MTDLVECVPNVSEGRDRAAVEEIVAAVRAVPGMRVLDLHVDVQHNRSVITYVAPVDRAVEAGLAVTRAAVERIDLRAHQGAHPRMGALDVFPFVPLGAVPLSRCVALAHELGARVADELSIPVYYYEEAALRPERRRLERVRRGGFEELREAIEHDPERAPDAGPARLHPSAGALAIGARRFLLAYNVFLGTGDVAVARRIARRIRASSGGLRGVKALGLEVGRDGETQVSMNLTDLRNGVLVSVMDLIRAEADRHGVAVTRSEVVGLIPLAAVIDAAAAFLQTDDLAPGRVLEQRLWEET